MIIIYFFKFRNGFKKAMLAKMNIVTIWSHDAKNRECASISK